jgi:hypothetical protein
MKPKGKTPTLLSQSTGKPFSDICKRKTVCTRCKQSITKGTKHFKIPKLQNGFTHHKPFCIECTKSIIEQTKKDLLEIEELFTDES